MDQVWGRIEKWFAEHVPEVSAGLNPPAKASQIAETEKFLGVEFPQAVRDCYLRHDGQDEDSPWMMFGWEWLSLERIRDEWSVWNDLLTGGDFDDIESEADGILVRQDWWNARWIPLTYSGAGDHHCLDLQPGPQGVAGQIIEMWHDDGVRPQVAASLTDWLIDYAGQLESGNLVFSDDYNAVVPKEDL